MNRRAGGARRARASVRQAVAAVALLLMVGLASAASLGDVRSAFTGLREGKADPDAVAAVVEGYRDGNRGSPLAMAYLGSVRSIQAARATIPSSMLSHSRK